MQHDEELIARICEEFSEEVKFVHYATDSTAHRNMFSILAQHLELFGTEAYWLYFEAGHGKGPCDGVGGVSKRMAFDYVRRGNTLLTAADYVAYANSSEKVMYLEVLRAKI